MSVCEATKVASGYQAWTRPSDWLALPTVNVGDQKVVALAAVFNTSNGNAFAVNCAGAYTVDWGDGTVDNVATGVQRNHTYTYASLSANNTSEGWRQAIVTITPQAGQTLTSVNFALTPSGTTTNYLQQWRDVKMAGSSVASVVMGSANTVNAMYWFEYVGPSAITNLTQAFKGLFNLRGITGTSWTATVTTFGSTFQNCFQLETIPLLDTHSALSFNNAFISCSRLRSFPLINTSACTDFTQMFQSCVSLTAIPLLNTSSGTNFTSMFSGCVSLTTIPLFVTTAGTNFSSMFSGCSSLASIPALDVGNGLNFASMFSSCSSLNTMPSSLNTAKGTDLSSMFLGCVSLLTHPAMTVTLATTLASMFNGCSSLSAINLPTSTANTSMNQMANSCVSLQSININGSAITSQNNAAYITAGSIPAGITSLVLTGLRFSTNTINGMGNQQLSASALNALYTSLGTASGAQTITVSGNPGSGSSTPSIATAKGWTVTGG